MSELRPFATVRSATFISALLMSTAFTVPAFAQIETVVVTAERKAEDIQTVPIAVSAFGSADLASHQITTFKDLQFNIPNVTVTNGNFGGANFQIRGIGSAAVATSGDNGVSVNMDDIYLDVPALANGTYYDLDRLEVLRGPQPTNFGRNATGGAINLYPKKPDLENFSVEGEVQYGNYNDREIHGTINLPIIDGKLGIRVAAFGELRDGDIKNIYPTINPAAGIPNNMDSRNDYSGRVSIRFQPTDDTTVDLMYQHSAEDDSRVRPVTQACHRDPSGVLGCLPDHLAFDPINLNSTLAYTFPSDIGLAGGSLFQLTQLGGAGGAPGGGASAIIPSDLHTVNSDFQPVNKGHDDFASFKLHQKLGSWLAADVLIGWDNQAGLTQQGYSNTIGESFTAAIPANVATSGGGIGVTQQETVGYLNFLGCPYAGLTTNRLIAIQEIFTCTYPTTGGAYFAGHFGTLPITGVGNGGLVAGNIRDYADHFQSYDQGDGKYREWSQELRFATSFDGPLNFLVGAYHISTSHVTNYFVNSTALDFISIVVPALFAGDGYVLGPSNYDNHTFPYKLDSSSVYGELYYDIIPDELKFTGGFRYTEDIKNAHSQQLLQNCLVPVGTPAAYLTSAFYADVYGTCPAIPGLSSPAEIHDQHTVFHALTGRAVLRWTPKLDFTDQTQVYASYTRGNRPGGFNPPSKSGLFPDAFASEWINAYEVGTKNTLLDNQLQANLTAWYYDYTGYQISKIIDRTSVNANINAKLWGIEGEFFWAPSDNWQFNASFGYTNSQISSGSDFDSRNPTQNDPNSTLVKDFAASNCVITNLAGTGPVTPSTNAFFAAILTDPPVTSLPGTAARVAFLNGSGSVQPLTYGLSCNTLQAAINAFAGSYGYNAAQFLVTPGGLQVSLKGNEMPNTPPFTFNVGAQYTFDFGGGYTLVPRVDYYWKDRMFANKFNAPTDLVKSWDETNAQLQLNAPDSVWYARLFVRNAFDKQNVTGSYVTDPSSGMFTNLFVEEPRTYGINIGAHF